MHCAITGAAGHVGSAIARCFQSHGWEVLVVGRRPLENTRHISYQLGADPQTLPWGEIDALVHGAWDFGLIDRVKMKKVNVDGSIALLCAAREHGVRRVVFISSLSAFSGCRSLYGKAKLEIEKAALELGCVVVRPGLVWSENPGSILGALERASQSRAVPLIGDGSYPQYLVHHDDLAELVYGLCQDDAPSIARPISAAHPQGHSLRRILEGFARKHDRHPLFVPIPWPLIYAGLKTLETLGLPAPFRSDSLLGIVFQNRAPQFALPEIPRITFRPYPV